MFAVSSLSELSILLTALVYLAGFGLCLCSVLEMKPESSGLSRLLCWADLPSIIFSEVSVDALSDTVRGCFKGILALISLVLRPRTRPGLLLPGADNPEIVSP